METTSRCSPHDHLVIIGNGMASHRLIEALVKQPTRPQRITVVGAEPTPAYNRILLSPLLAGEMQQDALTLRDTAWYADQGISLILGEKVETLDRARQTLTTDSGQSLDYDHLVIATGSRPALPDIPGIELEGVHGFRDLQDAEALEAIAHSGGDAVVIGGGLLGLEAAEGLRKRGNGIKVSVLQRSERLMNRQLDATAAHLLKDTLTQRGLNIITAAQLARLEGDDQGRVATLHLADGRQLNASSVIVAAGITPNAELGRQAGLTTERAIVVNEFLTTSDPAISALGECCQFDDTTYGLVEPIWRQVEVLAATLCGTATQGYADAPSATKLKISGVALYAFGPTEASVEHDVLNYHDIERGDYRRLLLRNGQIEGAVLYGDTSQGPWYFEQALAGSDLDAYRQALLFGAADVDVLREAASQHTPDSSEHSSKCSSSKHSSHTTSEAA
ncbi:NAD(P)/FAD-dependent oxidoreductase [Halomonas sp. ISL-60]|uniref:NAD(P)/FAD-dependent oxidoreductase n=1 Tax=Halomonas sp. ISL-56 TaxID=2819149 RepID=UPI001BEAEAF0|nr:FAD-dependent oxidoreductase [Halomonas sp. ISL-56]MBT2771008.1 NAD(P)/FAD-dependent oxidoreductase [Halomonas sp. ISL-60]MBT2802748.1 NAD(P)/FAD-dependent oxidoreductase [Halomonas sp. ISL-56]